MIIALEKNEKNKEIKRFYRKSRGQLWNTEDNREKVEHNSKTIVEIVKNKEK